MKKEHLKIKGWAYYWSIRNYIPEVEITNEYLSSKKLVKCSVFDLEKGDYFALDSEPDEFYIFDCILNSSTILISDSHGDFGGMIDLLNDNWFLKVVI